MTDIATVRHEVSAPCEHLLNKSAIVSLQDLSTSETVMKNVPAVKPSLRQRLTIYAAFSALGCLAFLGGTYGTNLVALNAAAPAAFADDAPKMEQAPEKLTTADAVTEEPQEAVWEAPEREETPPDGAESNSEGVEETIATKDIMGPGAGQRPTTPPGPVSAEASDDPWAALEPAGDAALPSPEASNGDAPSEDGTAQASGEQAAEAQ
jgi:hypothetical protein